MRTRPAVSPVPSHAAAPGSRPGVRAGRSRGFALLITITLLAFLVLLLVSLASLTRVETQVASNSLQLAQARQNALMALNIALGQLQRHAGPDQRVTVPATTVYPAKNVTNGTGALYDDASYGYRSHATTSNAVAHGTYLTPTERSAWDTALKAYWNNGSTTDAATHRNPYWVGVFDSSLRVNRAANPDSAPTALPRQNYETNPNTTFGEFVRASASPGSPAGTLNIDYQLPVWLVSGNENLNFDPASSTSYPAGYQTPDTVLPDPSIDPNYVWLVNTASATLADQNTDGLDGRVKVKKQTISGPSVIDPTSDQTIGHYAFWVGDESLKANFAVRDPYATAAINTPEYRNRLQVPQRLGWERMTGFTAASSLDTNSPEFLKVLSTGQIPFVAPALADPGPDAPARGAIPRNFHNLTAFSRSLLTDTALGGLKRDLTVLIDGSGSGVNPTSPILDRARYAPNDPRFGNNNGGFPASASLTHLPTWQELLDWANPSSSSVVGPGRAPVLSSYQMFFAFTYEDGRIQMHMVPCVVLWNPFDTALNATTYHLKWRHNFTLWKLGIATNGLADTTPATAADGGKMSGNNYFVHQLTGLDWYASSSSNYKQFGMILGGAPLNAAGTEPTYRISPFDVGTTQPAPSDAGATWVTYELTSRFEPGQVKVFTLGAPHKIDTPSALHSGSAVVPLTNTFDPVFPDSYYFDVATVGGPQPTADDFANNRVKFHAELLTGASTPSFMSMSLAIAGGSTLWRSEFLGNAANWQRNVNLAGTGAATALVASDPDKWRALYDYSTWGGIQKDTTTGDRASALMAMYRGRVTPFTPPAGDQFHTTHRRVSPRGANNHQRAFASFNLAAPNTDLDLNIEGSRATTSTSNTDNFNVQRLYFAEMGVIGDATGTAPNYAGWSASAHGPYNQTQVTGSDTEGFALMEWRSIDSSPASLRTKGISRLPLRQSTRATANLLSLGQFQQVNLSKLAWQPSFPVGNSEATPYVDRARVAGIESYSVGTAHNAASAAHTSYFRAAGPIPNQATNKQLDLSYLLNENLWDSYFLSSIPQSGSFTTYDLQTGATGTSSDPGALTLLPNSRHRLTASAAISASDVRDFNTASAYVHNVGALNVNTTSVEAWKALLTAFRSLAYASSSDDRPAATITNSIPVSRTLSPTSTALGGGNLEFTTTSKSDQSVGAQEVPGQGRSYQKFLTGFRYLTDDMIQRLAERIVDEVRLRGPFLSLSDFVNRRLVAPQGAYDTGSDWQTARTSNRSGDPVQGVHSYGVKPALFSGANSDSGNLASGYDAFKGMSGITGALQRAINLSGINGGMNYPLSPVDNNDRAFRIERDPTRLSSTNQPMQMYASNAHYLDTEHLAGAPAGEVGQLLSHSPGFVTQGDLLAMLGPALTPRGDTFIIRTYGDTVNPATGQVAGRAWLEAVVQRSVTPITPAETSGDNRFRPTDAFGRRFEVVSFRWLSEADL